MVKNSLNGTCPGSRYWRLKANEEIVAFGDIIGKENFVLKDLDC